MTRLAAIRVVVDTIAVAVAVETGYAARLGGAGRERDRKKHQGVAQRHEADRPEVLGLHGTRSLRVERVQNASRGERRDGYIQMGGIRYDT